MRKLSFIILLTAGFLSAGLSPDYGPTDWNAITSTSQGFVSFSAISINGENAVGGNDDGSPTGSCDSGDCDIIALMFGQKCIGWSYCTVSNDGNVTIAVNFNDFQTPGVEDYPTSGSSITVNLYDASAGLVYFGITNEQIQVFQLSYIPAGSVDVSEDGPTVGEVAGCPYVEAPEFDPFAGYGDLSLCNVTGCCDEIAVNSVQHTTLLGSCTDDGTCMFAGCMDDTAANFQGDGYDCSATLGADDSSCCSYAPVWDGVTGANVNNEDGLITTTVQISWDDPTAGTAGAGWDFSFPDGGTDCADGSGYCMEYDIGWAGSLSGEVCVTGGATSGIDGDPTGGEPVSDCSPFSLTTEDRPFPGEPSNVNVISSGQGFAELSWDLSYEADSIHAAFTNESDGSEIILSIDGSLSTAQFYPLLAGESYICNLSASNTFNGEVQITAAADQTSPGEIVISSFPEGNYVEIDTVNTVATSYAINLNWSPAPTYGGVESAAWEYQVYSVTGESSALEGVTSETSFQVFNLIAGTDYAFRVTATSIYGSIEGDAGIVSTESASGGPDWGYQIHVTNLGFGVLQVEDNYNYLGFSDLAEDGYDNALDLVDPPPTADDYVQFYLIHNDWDEEDIGWGPHYTQEVRKRDDSYYAFGNHDEDDIAVFNAGIISNMPGYGTIKFDLVNTSLDAPVDENDPNYCPTYLRVFDINGNTNYYKITDGTEVDFDIEANSELSMDIIIGNLVPEIVSGYTATPHNTHFDPINVSPKIDIVWEEPHLCEYLCNDFSSRYPADSYLMQFNDATDDITFTGIADGVFDESEPFTDTNGNGTWDSDESFEDLNLNGYWDGEEDYTDSNGNGNWDEGEIFVDMNRHIHPESGSLGYGTEYFFTLYGQNNCGIGADTTISVYTIENLPPTANAGSDSIYQTIHDGNPAATPLEVSLYGEGNDPEGIKLGLSWFQTDHYTDVELQPGNSMSVIGAETDTFKAVFQTGILFNSSPIEYEFVLTVTDSFPFGIEQSGGYSYNQDTVSITILPEQNQAPVSHLDISQQPEENDIVNICMAGETIIYENTDIITDSSICDNTDGEMVPYLPNDFYPWTEAEPAPQWRVPHDGDPLTNLANIQLANFSSDPDTMDVFTSLWSRSTPAEVYTDLNENGQYDYGEPFIDLNNNYNYDWSAAINIDILTTRIAVDNYDDTNGNGFYDNEEICYDIGNDGCDTGIETVDLIAQDPYGYRDTSQMIILILPEPNENPIVNAGEDLVLFLAPNLNSKTIVFENAEISDPDENDSLYFLWNDEIADLLPTVDLQEGVHEYTLCANDPYFNYGYDSQTCDTKMITIYPEPIPDKVDSLTVESDLYYNIISWDASDLNFPSFEYCQYLATAPEYEDIIDYECNNDIGEALRTYEHPFNADFYDIYRNGEFLVTVVQNEGIDEDPENFRRHTYIDNPIQPSTDYYYHIVPRNSYNLEGIISESVLGATYAQPTVEVISPNGSEIWASSYIEFNDGEYSEIIKAFPVTWEMTSTRNVAKIHIFVSHDNGSTWEQAEKFYNRNEVYTCSYADIEYSADSPEECTEADIEEVCSLIGSENECYDSDYCRLNDDLYEYICDLYTEEGDDCDGWELYNTHLDQFSSVNMCKSKYQTPMACRASGHVWNYFESICHPTKKTTLSYSGLDFQTSLDTTALIPETSSTADETITRTEYVKGEGIDINHNTRIKVILFDRGDYYDIQDDSTLGYTETYEDIGDESFTLSSNKVTRQFDVGWHIFGPPVKPYVPRMIDAFMEPHGFGEWGWEWAAFNQNGSFQDLYMEIGMGYWLYNTAWGNLTIYGDPVTSDEFVDYDGVELPYFNDYNNNGIWDEVIYDSLGTLIVEELNDKVSRADILIRKGWNLISDPVVRPINKYNFEVIHLEDGINLTFLEAWNDGFISPTIYGFENSYYTTDDIYPFQGYYIHASRGGMLLKMRPHFFDGEMEKKIQTDPWSLLLSATAMDGSGKSDQVKLAMNPNAADGFKYGEDDYNLPHTMYSEYIDLFMKRSWTGFVDVNGVSAESDKYFSDKRKMIQPGESQIWEISGYSSNITSDILLSWEMDEIDPGFAIALIIDGQLINMRETDEFAISQESLGNITVMIGEDPFTNAGLPNEFYLSHAFPNPFNPTTSLKMAIPEDSFGSVKVYNLMGQIVAVLHDGFIEGGQHQIKWDSMNTPSGIYFIRTEFGDWKMTRKLILLK